jgi:TetR/AcrR family transcriptional regulator, transcriptional repressor for nem operon
MRKEIIRKETRNNIISTSEELIRQKGFNAISYADIAERLKTKNAAIHYHFPTKFDLGRAVIDQEMARIAEYRERNAHLPGNEQLKHLVAVFYHNSVLYQICLVGSVTSEYATFNSYMQLAVQSICLSILDWVAELLYKGRTEGSLHFDGDSSQRALIVVSTLSSALLLNRVLDDEGIFKTMADLMLADLGVEWRIADLPEPGRIIPGIQLHSYT